LAEITELSLVEAACAQRAGELSSEELTRACLNRIQALDGQVHAFLHVAEELALGQAQAADRRLAAWRRTAADPPSLLAGLPLAVQDVLCLQGAPATCGSRILEGFRPPYTATSVRRLLDAGAVTLGKTNTAVYAKGSSTDKPA